MKRVVTARAVAAAATFTLISALHASGACFSHPSQVPGCTIEIPNDYSAFRDPNRSLGHTAHILQALRSDREANEIVASQLACDRGWTIVMLCMAQRFGTNQLTAEQVQRQKQEHLERSQRGLEQAFGVERGRQIQQDIDRSVKGFMQGLFGGPDGGPTYRTPEEARQGWNGVMQHLRPPPQARSAPVEPSREQGVAPGSRAAAVARLTDAQLAELEGKLGASERDALRRLYEQGQAEAADLLAVEWARKHGIVR